MSSARPISIVGFLARAGAFSRGTEAVLGLLLLYGAFEWFFADRSETSLYVILFAAPFATGTGLLSAAREGRLDLLFGAGATRAKIWRRAACRALVAPLLACLAAAPLFATTRMSLLELSVRAAGIVAFTGGVGFLVGLRNPRYVAGVVWVALRLVLLLSTAGAAVLVQLKVARSGGPVPPFRDLALSAFAFPELLLDPGASLLYVALFAFIGLAALVVSRAVFMRAELSGRRSA